MNAFRPSHEECRYKYVGIAPHEIMTLLGGWKTHSVLQLPILDGVPGDCVPQDCAVDDVHWDACSREFRVLLYHESFEPVPAGEDVPRINLASHVVTLDLDAVREVYVPHCMKHKYAIANVVEREGPFQLRQSDLDQDATPVQTVKFREFT